MKGLELYDLFRRQGYSLSTDTRKIREGDIYLALKGENFNGNHFAQDALDKGAAYAIVDEAPEYDDPRIICVQNALHALWEIATGHRRAMKARVLGIAGSNGKTTTKEFIHSVLSKKYNCTATRGNLNNHIGVPLSLLEIEAETEIAIIEMGANHPGEVQELCEIAEPDMGLVTSIGKEHLEGFGSMENIIETELALLRYVKARKGQCFLFVDDPVLSMHREEFKDALTYGSRDADCIGLLESSDGPLAFKWDTNATSLKNAPLLECQIWGDFNFGNALAAACLGRFFGVSYASINNAISEYSPENKRSQLLFARGSRIIMDCYNANPSSMELALKSFERMKSCLKKIAILGDMLEMGEHSMNEHQNIVDLCTALQFDKVLLVGEEFGKTNIFDQRFEKFDDVVSLSQQYKIEDFDPVCILLKASRGIRLEKFIDA